MLVACPKCGIYHDAQRDGTECHRCKAARRPDWNPCRCWRCVRSRALSSPATNPEPETKETHNG
jgi:hypothetical protein